jgi:hypothetical protein
MGKNWLIRTKSNHILGPVSKEKVLELYQNGSIKQDDEICSGNGYWFFIRENDLVEKYLLGNDHQSFNPISEAKDVLTSSGSSAGYQATRDDITIIGGIDLRKMQDAPVVQKNEVSSPSLNIEVEESPKKKTRTEVKANQSANPGKQKKQNYFKYLLLLIFIILFSIIYFRKSILKSFFANSFIQALPSIVIAQAQAQSDRSSKKKNF